MIEEMVLKSIYGLNSNSDIVKQSLVKDIVEVVHFNGRNQYFCQP